MKTKSGNSIALVGFMATGKTAVGKLLAKKLKMKYVSTDSLVEKLAAKKISKIFELFGEEHFRTLETKVLSELKPGSSYIISCGGGIVLKEKNVALLKQHGLVIWLKATPEAINSRLKDISSRPLLNITDPVKRLKEIKNRLKVRAKYYKNAADFSLDTTNLDPTQVANAIEACYEERV